MGAEFEWRRKKERALAGEEQKKPLRRQRRRSLFRADEQFVQSFVTRTEMKLQECRVGEARYRQNDQFAGHCQLLGRLACLLSGMT